MGKSMIFRFIHMVKNKCYFAQCIHSKPSMLLLPFTAPVLIWTALHKQELGNMEAFTWSISRNHFVALADKQLGACQDIA